MQATNGQEFNSSLAIISLHWITTICDKSNFQDNKFLNMGKEPISQKRKSILGFYKFIHETGHRKYMRKIFTHDP